MATTSIPFGIDVTANTVDAVKDLNKLQAELQGTIDDLKRVSANEQEVARGFESFRDKLKEATEGNADLAATAYGLKQIASQLQSLGFDFGVSLQKYQDFEKSISEVSTLLKDTSGLKAQNQAVRELAVTFGQEAVVQAAALYQTISAGISATADAMNTLTVANKLAVGGATDVFTAVDGLTSIMNAYHISAQQAGYVSDVMFATMKRGKTTIQELSDNIGNVTGIASQAGVSFEDMMASIATITLSGKSTSEAVTALRGAISAVLTPSAEAADLAERLKIQFNVAAISAKGLAGFIADITEKTKGSQESLGTLFGNIRGLSGVMSLAGTNASTFQSIIKELGDSGDYTDEAMAKMSDTLEFSSKRLATAWNEIQISMGSGLSPIVKQFNNYTADFLIQHKQVITTIATLATGGTAVIGSVAAIGIAYAGLVPILGTLVAQVNTMAEAKRNSAKAIAEVTGALTLEEIATSAATSAAVILTGNLENTSVAQQQAAVSAEEVATALKVEALATVEVLKADAALLASKANIIDSNTKLLASDANLNVARQSSLTYLGDQANASQSVVLAETQLEAARYKGASAQLLQNKVAEDLAPLLSEQSELIQKKAGLTQILNDLDEVSAATGIDVASATQAKIAAESELLAIQLRKQDVDTTLMNLEERSSDLLKISNASTKSVATMEGELIVKRNILNDTTTKYQQSLISLQAIQNQHNSNISRVVVATEELSVAQQKLVVAQKAVAGSALNPNNNGIPAQKFITQQNNAINALATSNLELVTANEAVQTSQIDLANATELTSTLEKEAGTVKEQLTQYETRYNAAIKGSGTNLGKYEAAQQSLIDLNAESARLKDLETAAQLKFNTVTGDLSDITKRANATSELVRVEYDLKKVTTEVQNTQELDNKVTELYTKSLDEFKEAEVNVGKSKENLNAITKQSININTSDVQAITNQTVSLDDLKAAQEQTLAQEQKLKEIRAAKLKVSQQIADAEKLQADITRLQNDALGNNTIQTELNKNATIENASAQSVGAAQKVVDTSAETANTGAKVVNTGATKVNAEATLGSAAANTTEAATRAAATAAIGAQSVAVAASTGIFSGFWAQLSGGLASLVKFVSSLWTLIGPVGRLGAIIAGVSVILVAFQDALGLKVDTTTKSLKEVNDEFKSFNDTLKDMTYEQTKENIAQVTDELDRTKSSVQAMQGWWGKLWTNYEDISKGEEKIKVLNESLDVLKQRQLVTKNSFTDLKDRLEELNKAIGHDIAFTDKQAESLKALKEERAKVIIAIKAHEDHEKQLKIAQDNINAAYETGTIALKRQIEQINNSIAAIKNSNDADIAHFNTLKAINDITKNASEAQQIDISEKEKLAESASKLANKTQELADADQEALNVAQKRINDAPQNISLYQADYDARLKTATASREAALAASEQAKQATIAVMAARIASETYGSQSDTLKSLSSSILDTSEYYNRINNELQNNTVILEKVTSANEKIKNQYNETSQASSTAKNALQELTSKYGDNTETLKYLMEQQENLSNNLSKTKVLYEETKDTYGANSQEAIKLADSIKGLNQEYASNGESIQETVNKGKNLSDQISKMNVLYDETTVQHQKNTEEAMKLADSMRVLDKEYSTNQKALQETTNKQAVLSDEISKTNELQSEAASKYQESSQQVAVLANSMQDIVKEYNVNQIVIQQTTKAHEGLTNQISAVKQSYDEAATKYKQNSLLVESLAINLQNLGEEYKSNNSALQETKLKQDSLTSTISENNSLYEEAKNKYGENSQQAIKLADSIKGLNQQYNSNAITIQETISKQESLSVQVSKANQLHDESKIKYQESASQVTELSNKLQNLGIEYQNNESKINSLLVTQESLSNNLSETNKLHTEATNLSRESSQQATVLANKTQVLDKEFNSNKTTLEELTTNHENLTKQIDNTNKSYDEATNKYIENSQTTTELSNNMQELDKEYQANELKLKSLTSTKEDLNVKIQQENLLYKETKEKYGASSKEAMKLADSMSVLKKEYYINAAALEEIIKRNDELVAATNKVSTTTQSLDDVTKQYNENTTILNEKIANQKQLEEKALQAKLYLQLGLVKINDAIQDQVDSLKQQSDAVTAQNSLLETQASQQIEQSKLTLEHKDDLDAETNSIATSIQAINNQISIKRDLTQADQDAIAILEEMKQIKDVDIVAIEKQIQAKKQEILSTESSIESDKNSLLTKELLLAKTREVPKAFLDGSGSIDSMSSSLQTLATNSVNSNNDIESLNNTIKKGEEASLNLAAAEDDLVSVKQGVLDKQAAGLKIAPEEIALVNNLTDNITSLNTTIDKGKQARDQVHNAQLQAIADADLLEKAAKAEQERIKELNDDSGRELDLRNKTNEIKKISISTNLELNKATLDESVASGDANKIREAYNNLTKSSSEALQLETDNLNDQASVKRQQAVLAEEAANAKYIETNADMEYTAAEQAQVDALKDSAKALSLEADLLEANSKQKQENEERTNQLKKKELEFQIALKESDTSFTNGSKSINEQTKSLIDLSDAIEHSTVKELFFSSQYLSSSEEISDAQRNKKLATEKLISASKLEQDNIQATIAANGRDLDIRNKQREFTSKQIDTELQLINVKKQDAIATGDVDAAKKLSIQSLSLSNQMEQNEIDTLAEQATSKRQQIELIHASADAAEIAAKAVDGYDASEKASVDAMRDSAILLEADTKLLEQNIEQKRNKISFINKITESLKESTQVELAHLKKLSDNLNVELDLYNKTNEIKKISINTNVELNKTILDDAIASGDANKIRIGYRHSIEATTEALKLETESLEIQANIKREQADLAQQSAKAKYIEAYADMEYTSAEQAQVKALENSATALNLEADALQANSKQKQENEERTNKLKKQDIEFQIALKESNENFTNSTKSIDEQSQSLDKLNDSLQFINTMKGIGDFARDYLWFDNAQTEATSNAMRLQKEAIEKLVAASKIEQENIQAVIGDMGRELEIRNKKNDIISIEIDNKLKLIEAEKQDAIASNDNNRVRELSLNAIQLSYEAEQNEIEIMRDQAKVKREQAELTMANAHAVELESMAVDGYSTAEKAAVDAIKDNAKSLLLEADILDINTNKKSQNAALTMQLRERELELDDARKKALQIFTEGTASIDEQNKKLIDLKVSYESTKNQTQQLINVSNDLSKANESLFKVNDKLNNSHNLSKTEISDLKAEQISYQTTIDGLRNKQQSLTTVSQNLLNIRSKLTLTTDKLNNTEGLSEKQIQGLKIQQQLYQTLLVALESRLINVNKQHSIEQEELKKLIAASKLEQDNINILNNTLKQQLDLRNKIYTFISGNIASQLSLAQAEEQEAIASDNANRIREASNKVSQLLEASTRVEIAAIKDKSEVTQKESELMLKSANAAEMVANANQDNTNQTRAAIAATRASVEALQTEASILKQNANEKLENARITAELHQRQIDYQLVLKQATKIFTEGSASIDEQDKALQTLNNNVEQARKKVKDLEDAHNTGKQVEQELANARKNLTEQTSILNETTQLEQQNIKNLNDELGRELDLRNKVRDENIKQIDVFIQLAEAELKAAEESKNNNRIKEESEKIAKLTAEKIKIETNALLDQADVKKKQTILANQAADAMERQVKSDGVYTAAEQAAVEAMRDTAKSLQLESDALNRNANEKNRNVKATAELRAVEIELAIAFANTIKSFTDGSKSIGEQSSILRRLAEDAKNAANNVKNLEFITKDSAQVTKDLTNAQTKLDEITKKLSNSQELSAQQTQQLKNEQTFYQDQVTKLTFKLGEAKNSELGLAEARKRAKAATDLVVEAAKLEQENIKNLNDDIQRELDLRLKSNEIKSKEVDHEIDVTQSLLDEAIARGDSNKIRELSAKLATENKDKVELETKAIDDQADTKRQQAELARQSAQAKYLEVTADGDYTAAEKAQVDALYDSANAMDLEAESLNKDSTIKKENATIAAELQAKQSAVNEVVAEAKDISEEAASAAKAAGDAAIEQGASADEAARAARDAAEEFKKLEPVTIDLAHALDVTGKSFEGLEKYADEAGTKFNEVYNDIYNANIKGATGFQVMADVANDAMKRAVDAAIVEAQHAKAIDDLSTSLGSLTSAYDSGNISVDEYKNKLKSLEMRFGSLGAEELSGLRSALKDVMDTKLDTLNDELSKGNISIQDYEASVRGLQGEFSTLGKEDLAGLQDALDSLVDTKLDALTEQLDNGTMTIADYIKAVNGLKSEYKDLGNEKLKGLNNALQDAIDRTKELEDSAKSALSSALDAYDEAFGTNHDLQKEQISWQQDLAELQSQLAIARAAGDAQAVAILNEAISLQTKAHDKRMKDLESEARASGAAFDRIGQSANASAATSAATQGSSYKAISDSASSAYKSVQDSTNSATNATQSFSQSVTGAAASLGNGGDGASGGSGLSGSAVNAVNSLGGVTGALQGVSSSSKTVTGFLGAAANSLGGVGNNAESLPTSLSAANAAMKSSGKQAQTTAKEMKALAESIKKVHDTEITGSGLADVDIALASTTKYSNKAGQSLGNVADSIQQTHDAGSNLSLPTASLKSFNDWLAKVNAQGAMSGFDASTGRFKTAKDGMDKVSASIENQMDSIASNNVLYKTWIDNQIAALDIEIELAIAKGNTAKATQLSNTRDQLSINLAKENATYVANKAKLAWDLVAAKEKEAKADRVVTNEEKDAIQTLIDNAKALNLNVQSERLVAKAKEQSIKLAKESAKQAANKEESDKRIAEAQTQQANQQEALSQSIEKSNTLQESADEAIKKALEDKIAMLAAETAAIEAQSTAIDTNLGLLEKQIANKQALLDIDIANAEASGNDALVAELTNKRDQLSIDLAKEKFKAKQKQYELAQKIVTAKIAEANVDGILDDAERNAIQTARNTVASTKLESESLNIATAALINSIEQKQKATINQQQIDIQNVGSVQSNIEILEAQSNAINTNLGFLEKQIANKQTALDIEIAHATAIGNTTLATQLSNDRDTLDIELATQKVIAKQQQLTIAENTVQAKINEANADEILTSAELASIQSAKDNVTTINLEAQSLELARIALVANTQAKQEAAAQALIAAQNEALLQQATESNTLADEAAKAALDAKIAALQANTAAIENQSSAISTNLGFLEQQIANKQAALDIEITHATAIGNTNLATQLSNERDVLDIELAQAKAIAKGQQAELSLQLIDAKIAEANADNILTDAELASIQSAKDSATTLDLEKQSLDLATQALLAKKEATIITTDATKASTSEIILASDAIKAQIETETALADIKKTAYDNELEALNIALQKAQAAGDEANTNRILAEQTTLSIVSLKEQANSKDQLAILTMNLVNAKREEALVDGVVSDAEKIAIDTLANSVIAFRNQAEQLRLDAEAKTLNKEKTDDLTASTIALNDSVQDTSIIDGLNAQAAALASNQALYESANANKIKAAEIARDAAIAHGNEAEALRQTNFITTQELELLKYKTSVKEQSIKIQKDLIDATIKQANADKELTTEEKSKINALKESLNTKLQELDASELDTKSKVQQIELTTELSNKQQALNSIVSEYTKFSKEAGEAALAAGDAILSQGGSLSDIKTAAESAGIEIRQTTLDNLNLEKALNKLKSQYDTGSISVVQYNKELSSLNTQRNESLPAIEAVKTALDETASTIADNVEQNNTLQTSFKDLQSQYKTNAISLTEYNSKLGELSTNYDASLPAYNELNLAFNSTTLQIKEATKANDDLIAKLESLKKSNDAGTLSNVAYGAALKQIKDGANESLPAFNDLVGVIDEVNTAITEDADNALSDRIDNLSTAYKNGKITATGYEQTLKNIRNIADQSLPAFADLKTALEDAANYKVVDALAAIQDQYSNGKLNAFGYEAALKSLVATTNQSLPAFGDLQTALEKAAGDKLSDALDNLKSQYEQGGLSLHSYQSQLQELSTSTNKNIEGFDGIAKALDTVNKAITAAANDALLDKLAGYKTAYDAGVVSMAQYQLNLDSLSKTADATLPGFEDVKTALTDINQEINQAIEDDKRAQANQRLSDTLSDLQKQYDKGDLTNDQYRESLQNLSSTADKSLDSFKNIASEINNLDNLKAQQSLDDLNQKYKDGSISIDEYKNSLLKLIDNTDSTLSSYSNITKALYDVNQSIKDNNEINILAEEAAGKLLTQYQNGTLTVDQYKEALQKLLDATNGGLSTLKGYVTSLDEVEGRYNNQIPAINILIGRMQELEATARAAKAAIDAVSHGESPGGLRELQWRMQDANQGSNALAKGGLKDIETQARKSKGEVDGLAKIRTPSIIGNASISNPITYSTSSFNAVPGKKVATGSVNQDNKSGIQITKVVKLELGNGKSLYGEEDSVNTLIKKLQQHSLVSSGVR